jgi:hypothetical protein
MYVLWSVALGVLVAAGAILMLRGCARGCVGDAEYPASTRQEPGTFHRKRYEAVVDRVRQLALKPGEVAQLKLDDLENPDSLRRVRPGERFGRCQKTGRVWAVVDKVGKLKVVIETRDLGHDGEFGFAYSDAPLTPSPAGEHWFNLDLPGDLVWVKPHWKIDDNWWRVANVLT